MVKNLPIIIVEMGKISTEKKGMLINRLTDAVVEAGYRSEDITVLIHENILENVGSGGKQLSELIKER